VAVAVLADRICRWDALTDVEKLTIRVGREEAARRLAQRDTDCPG